MALSVTMCPTFLVVLLALAGVHSQVSVQLSCSPGWTLDGDRCYRLTTNLLSWQSALEVCRIEGAYLPRIGDIYTNKQLGSIATASGVTNFWIGLNIISVPATNTSYLEWSDGAPSSIYQAFWEELQPNLSAGSCVYVSESHPDPGNYRWSLGPCEWKRAFMCELPACPSGSFQCSTGECTQSSRTCDGTQDCADGSDEINCRPLCKEYLTGPGGNILSPNYPGGYPILTDCQWTIEGPIGSNILLQVNNIDTQSGVDELVVMGGGRTASFSQNLARLSGVTASPNTIPSSNNFMIIRFYSDGAIQGTGFNLTWTAVQTGIQDAGQQLTASPFVQYLRSPTYLSNQETVWVISTPHARTIITLEVFISNQRRKMDLAPGDMIYVRDGGDASAPLLAQYSSTSGPLFVISTGPQLYILMKTMKHSGVTNAGFEFRYYTGCVISLHENNGELFSPGYGVVNYANYVTCTYTISPISAQRTTLRFDSTYDIEFQNDKLQVFIGVNDKGNPMHSTADGGYVGTVAPRPVSSVSGRIYVRFQTNAIDDRPGWRATYSQSCQNPNFNSDTILTPSASYDYGDTFNVSCPVGYVFSSLEFYTKQQDGSLVSLTSVYMECVFGGTWNVRNTPQCVPADLLNTADGKYCGQAPEISNGYVQSATGAVFGSTASYVCAEGYTAVGNTDITCQQDGTWQTPPTCAGATCPAINIGILDGTSQLTQGNGVSAGTVYTFTCNAGHVISGSPIVNCNSSGVWTYPVPTCQKLQCPTPILANGNVFASGLSFINVGVTLAVNCRTAGYQLVGSPTITCQGDQTFTTLPVCQDLNECLNGPCPADSDCTNTDGSYTCTCQSGFQQNGALCNDVNECNTNNGGCSDTCVNSPAGSYTCSCPQGSTLFTQNQTMGYSIPASETGLRFGDTYYIDHTCVRNQCPTPSAIPNGYLTEKRVLYSFGDTVTFSCAPGYVLTGQTTLQCQASGTWSAEIPTCEVAKCPADVVPQNLINNPTSVSPSGEVNFGAVVTITCNVPGVGVFTKTRTCRFDPGQQVYRLQGDSYECGVVNCGQPLLPKGGRILSTLTNTTYGATFEFYCNFNYEVAGSNNLGTNTITCAADSYWTFFNVTCLERQCPFPGVPAGGDVSFEGNGYDYYDNVTFTCQRSGFEPEVGVARCGVAEDSQNLNWGIPTPPKCLDVESPSFTNCPSSPVSVSRYASAGFPVPNAQDNSGSVKSVTVSPAYFYPTQPVDQGITVTYTVTDHAGLTDVCVVNIVVKDETPPTIQCPGEEVIRLSVSQSAYRLYDPASANVTYNTNDAVLTFTPSVPLNYSYAEVGTSTIFTATVTDFSGNSASCQFQVVIEALLCEANTLKSANTNSQCQPTNSGGQSCTFTCDSGFYFYEDYPTESFTSTCEPGQPYNSSYVPSCVQSAPVLFNMAITLQYQASPSAEISEVCQQSFNTSLITQLSGLGATLKQPCVGQQNIAAVTYNQGSLRSTYDSNNQQLQVQFTLLFESTGGSANIELEYLQCYANLRLEFLKFSQDTGDLLSLRNLTSPGCPDVFGTSIKDTDARTCDSNYKYRNPNNVDVCLPCPPGTSKSGTGTCDLCVVGEYWVTANAPLYGQCVSCSRGQATAAEGSIGAESCIEQCDGNLVSSSGVPPCRECTGNTFALNSTYCQECPANTLALRNENPLNVSCNNPEAFDCTYSIIRNVAMLSVAIQTHTSTIAECEGLCDRWETLPFTSSQCIGFNYNNVRSFCFLYDTESQFETNLEYDYYERSCAARNLKDCYCAPMCQAGYHSITGYQPNCLPCPMGFISTTGAATSCQACTAGETTLSQASTSCVTDGASVVCQNNPCQNNGNCSVLLHDAYCTCEPGFTGRYCEQRIDFCASSPCYNNATCISSTQGFSCSCLSGFNGSRCEENINNCSLDSCNRKGTCIDQVNGFTCACLENYQGNQCEQQELRGCDIFPCGGNSTCRNTNDYHRVCDCFPGFTGPLCDMEINECESQPCLNGGTCTDRVNSFECACRASFNGDRCELPVKLCSGVSCGIADSCVDDAVTGLPLCICRSGYTQGELCQYSYNAETTVSVGTSLEAQNVTETSQCRALCDARGDQCQAFVFRLNTLICTLYSQVVSTVPVNTAVDGPTSLSVKRCTYPRDDFIYTEWFNTNNPRTGIELEAYASIQAFGLTVCENTEPVDVECRVAATQGTIPAGLICQLSGLQCTPSPTCPDMEIRYKCARSRVFEDRLCSVRDVCSERSTCATGSQCINDPLNPKGFSCGSCPQGFTGDLCQLTKDECAVQPCLNSGTCVDEFLTFSCNCPVGFEGTRCETNPDDCVPNLCDFVGTQRCEDGLNDYTCVCRLGFMGKNCSVNINECASTPCLHGATCVDLVNGYRCDCAAGWTGQQCETVVDLCSPFTPCSNGANCTTLFNDYSCSCPAGVYGTQCTYVPSLLQCNNNNPCVNPVECSTNGIQAVCNCASGKEGVGCQFGTYYSCDSSPCQNGATCSANGAGVTCSCVSGYSGGLCEVNNDDCATTNCPAAATCIDGINQAYCRCPVGKAAPTCSADIDENYDVCFSPSLVTAGAALPYALPVSNLEGFTVMVWVRYDQAGGSGTFLTMYTSSSASATGTRTEILRLDESGMYVNVFGNRTLSYNLFPINDGLWHLVVMFWNSATGDLDLTTDYLRQDRTRSYGRGQRITANFLLVLGGTENTAALSTAFSGCVSGVNMRSRGLDFTADLPDLQSQPSRYQGDLLRWAEFQEYGNTRFARPSTARLVNCVANPSEPACITQSRDSVAPVVTSCPDDIIVDTIFSDAYASWTPPTFTGGAVAVSASHQPGELFQRGSTAVVYAVEDQAGNTAVCTFTVFVGGTTCPAVDPPRGGGIQVCQLQSDNFDACSASCPATNTTLVDDVPSYYSCGPSGLWETLDDHGGLYPTCGRIVTPARADIQLHMNYQITTGQCSTITQGITTRSREDLTSMLQRWGGDMCRSSDCTDITPVVNCSSLSSTYVDIQLSNVSALMSNGLVQRSVQDVWEAAVLDNDIFRFDTIIPQATLNAQAYSVQVTYICEVGQVVREQMCVECGPGTFYNTSTLHCDNCPVGQYASGYAALSCTPCPQGQTTRSIGSTSVSDCATSCPVGQYHNGSRCALCPTAFYQNQTGQFECRPCPRGYLTLVEGSTSESSCAEGCQSGYELLVNGTCVPCAQGTYRQYGLDQTCIPCRSGYTTPTDASISADNCTVLRCPAGSKANASVTGCELCPRGQYQPQANQLGCLPCPTNYTTAQSGSLQASDCQEFCPSGYQLVSGQCEVCPVASYKDNSVDPLTLCLSCPAGYLTAGPASTALAACSIRNCSAGFFIQSDNQGVETCALCPLDQYSSQPYQKSCTPCPSGTGTRQTGADNLSLCEALCPSGEELVNGSCVQCAQGYYKDNSVERFAQCSVCPAEFITAGAGSTSLGDCNISNCSAGFFREVANNTCMECPLSTYQPDRWQTSCIACPSERLTEITGATGESQCLLSCSPGRQDQNGTCEPCPVGSYKNRTGAVSCYPCPPNLRTAGNASTDVADCNIVACQPGSILNATENTCAPCPYGQYQPDQWQSSCLPCPSGLTTLVVGATSTSQCLTDCPVGNELNLTANACEPCNRGYYRDKSTDAQISCELCTAAFITASTGSTSASDCSVANCTSPGRYLNTATNLCDMCPLGTYNSQWWAESCTSCPSSFTTKTDGVATVDNCYRDCPSGQQVDEPSNVCSNCVIGTYRDKTQTWTCQPCPSPLTTLNPGSTAVNACDIPTCGPGLFYNSTQAQCLQCPMGTYQPQSAQRSCITCPDSRTTLAAGRTTVSDCVSACETVQNTCSSNADCSLNNSGDVVCTCQVNYQGDGQTCTHVCDLSTDYCKNGATCVKERDSPCVCASYYSGNRCETRADPSKDTINTEVIVGVVIGVVVFIMLLLLILIGIIVRRRGRKRASDKDSLSTSNSQSRPPSAIIPRINTQNYRNFTPENSFNKSYDPAYYHAQDRDVSSFAYDNATYRCKLK